MSKVLFSFCIPTYGQPEKIKKTLESLLNQDLDGVEIVIRDDNSDSQTEEIIKTYCNMLPIRYFRMQKQGIDEAFIFLSGEAQGEFVWWFGDDVLFPGVFRRVKDVLQKYKNIDFMYINSTDISGGIYSVNSTGSKFFVSRDDVLSEIKDLLGFCSAILVRRDILVSGLDGSRAFVGSAFVTLFLVLHALVVSKSFYFLDGKNFFSDEKPPGEERWYDQFQVFGINYPKVVSVFRESFKKETIRFVIRDNLRRILRAIFSERAVGLKTGFGSQTPKIIPLLKTYWGYWEFWVAIPLLLIPRSILRWFYLAYKNSRLGLNK